MFYTTKNATVDGKKSATKVHKTLLQKGLSVVCLVSQSVSQSVVDVDVDDDENVPKPKNIKKV